MTGNDLLWVSGKVKKTADFTMAAEDIELDRLGALLLSHSRILSGEEAMNFLMPLTTKETDTIVMRQRIISDLLNNPSLLIVFKELSNLIAGIRFYSEGMDNNTAGFSVTKVDAALDGFKKVIISMEKNISRQSAEIREEIDADNRYAQLLRAVLFRYELIKSYSKAMGMLKEAFANVKLESETLIAFKQWAETCYKTDDIEGTVLKLTVIEGWWKGISGFAIDICMNGSRQVVGLEIAEIRSEPYEKNGMLEPEPKNGITGLFAFPQNGSAVAFQEYLLSEVGYELRNGLTRLRGEIVKLSYDGKDDLLSFDTALNFYIAAAGLCRRLKETGLPVCVPEFSESVQIEAIGAYMPEFALTAYTVQNDIYLAGSGSTNLITGPNSSGKTSYIVTVGQLIWLFQLGCLLPCKKAVIKPVDQILTLFASGESSAGEDSRMGMEVIKIAEITDKMTQDSLVLLNEPMTSTSAAEGIDICIDLLSEFISKKVSSMMVTHFTDIYGLLVKRFEEEGISDRLKSYVMTANINKDGSVEYLYKLIEAPPLRSSHARAVVGKLGVTLDAMLTRLDGLGLDVRPAAPAWDTLRKEML